MKYLFVTIITTIILGGVRNPNNSGGSVLIREEKTSSMGFALLFLILPAVSMHNGIADGEVLA